MGKLFLGLHRWQAGILIKQYGDDRMELFSAKVLLSIVVGFIAILLATLVYFSWIDPSLIDIRARSVFTPMEIVLIALFFTAYCFLLFGKFKTARGIVSTTMITASLLGVFLTGGFPGSVTTPVLIILPVMVYLLHGGRAGLSMTLILPIVLITQWILVEQGLLTFPDFTSKASPIVNKMLVLVLTYASVISVVASFQFQNVRLRRELARERANLAELANRDVLTGLYNSRYFYAELERAATQAFAGNDRLAILFLDLDNFKQINDNHGHPVGDGVLQEVARRLQNCVRLDDVVARMGGDEFAVMMRVVDSESAIEDLADRLRRAITRPIILDGIECQVGTSIGSSVYPDVAYNAQNLLKTADQAMYCDKLKKLAREMREVEGKAAARSDEDSVRAA